MIHPVRESFAERVARLAYTGLGVAIMPLLCGHLLWRGLRQPDYWRHWAERFLGRSSYAVRSNWLSGERRANQQVLWVHAVSVGETRAVAPLIHRWLAQSDNHFVLLTHTTPTGRATGAELFGKWIDMPVPRLVQRYLPYDLPWACRRFLRDTQPALGVLMETELWPNLLASARRYGLPMVLINARLSPRSRERLRRFRLLSRPAIAGLAGVAAQTLHDADGFRAVLTPMAAGNSDSKVSMIQVLGNMKFDVAVPEHQQALGQQWRTEAHSRSCGGPAPRVWAAISTRDDEEATLFAAWRQARIDGLLGPQDVLLVVPRHPQRFDRVAQLATQAGFMVGRRSMQWMTRSADQSQPVAAASEAAEQVLIGDSLGEMFAYLEMADLVLIGGSLAALGGQNPLEACALGRPVFFGPHMFNFSQIARELKACGAGLEVTSVQDWLHQGLQSIQNDHQWQSRGERARAFTQQHRGASARTEAFLAAILREVR